MRRDDTLYDVLRCHMEYGCYTYSKVGVMLLYTVVLFWWQERVAGDNGMECM